ncbi:MAG: zinc ribbon domain-containing protein [Pseudomonadota bacterium]
MHCPKCAKPTLAGRPDCPHCGIVFAKYAQHLERQSQVQTRIIEAETDGRLRRLWRMLLTPPAANRSFWYARVAAWGLFVVWGGHYLLQSIADLGNDPGFLHNVDLVFHEAGHAIFGLLGQFIGSLGGTLGQLLMPLVCGLALLRQHDSFGASLCLWWIGQNFLDIAPYMADARAGQLPLLGGNFGHSAPYGFHDWEYLLTETGLLAHDQGLALACLSLGRLLMVLGLAWGAYLLWHGRPGAAPR